MSYIERELREVEERRREIRRAAVALTDAERLSRLLWDAREWLEMYASRLARTRGADTVAVAARLASLDVQRTLREIDKYRAERGWSPDGFGGETS